MHILITGGSGFIGQALCPALVEDGHQLIVLSRDPDAARKRLPPQVRYIKHFDQLEGDPVDAIINLAGESLGEGRWTTARKQAFFASRVGLTNDLVEWMHARSERGIKAPSAMVSGSAVGYYGAQGDTPVTETTRPNDEFQHRLCRDWETAALRMTSFGVRVSLLRIGVVIGQGGGALQAMQTPFKLGLGGWLGSGKQWMSWIHRSDLVRLIQTCLDADSQLAGPINATAPNPVTNKQFSKALGAALNRPVLMPVPGPILRLMVGEMAHLLLTGQRVVPERARATGFEFDFPNIEPALAEATRSSPG